MPEVVSSTTTNFDFTMGWDDALVEGDFVSISVSGSEYVAQVTETRTSGDKIKATATVLGEYPDLPFKKGTSVERADPETVIETFDLPDEGLHLGSIRSFDVEVKFEESTTMEKHIGVFGRTDTGKSYTAAVLAEELLEANKPLVVFDPHGEYASLQVSADGEPSPYKVKEYADQQYVQTADEELADITDYSSLVRPGQATVLNLKGISDERRMELVDTVLNELYRARVTGEIPQTKVIVDEAHQFAGTKKSERCEMMRTIASEGRKFGFTLELVSQRPASIDTNVRSQLQMLIIHKLTDGTDVSKAVESAEGLDTSWSTQIQKLSQGQCVMAGDLLETPLFVDVRERRTSHHASSGETFDVEEYADDPKSVEKQQESLEEQVSAHPDERLRTRVSELRSEVERLREEKRELETKLTNRNESATGPEIDELQSKLQEKEHQIKELQQAKNELEQENEQLRQERDRLEDRGSSDERRHVDSGETGSAEFGLADPSFVYDTIDQFKQEIQELPEVEQKMLRWYMYNTTGRAETAYANAGRSPNSSKRRDHAEALVKAGFLKEKWDGREKKYEYALEDKVDNQLGAALESEHVESVVDEIEETIAQVPVKA